MLGACPIAMNPTLFAVGLLCLGLAPFSQGVSNATDSLLYEALRGAPPDFPLCKKLEALQEAGEQKQKAASSPAGHHGGLIAEQT